MTPAQKLEARRLTPLMRDLLKAAWAAGDGLWIVRPHDLRSARILERRGFVSIEPDAAGGHIMSLTSAGNAIAEPPWRAVNA